jgi:hypothetical protein
MKAPYTPGPWRWEINRKHRGLHLVGGLPQYDLTIMNFARWGMGGAVATLRDTAEAGFNIMHRLPDRPDWIAPLPHREHHADWCAGVTHPDMLLMAAAPDLLEALRALVDMDVSYQRGPVVEDAVEKARAAIAKATQGEQR